MGNVSPAEGAGVDYNRGTSQARCGIEAYEREQPVNDSSAYSDAENEPKATRRGLWTDVAPIPPWEFRHKR